MTQMHAGPCPTSSRTDRCTHPGVHLGVHGASRVRIRGIPWHAMAGERWGKKAR